MVKRKGILYSHAFYTLLSILFGFIVGAVLLAAAGINPALAYGKLVSGVFGKYKYIVYAFVYASPLIFTGLSVAFSFRTGIFNIGAEGQYVVGSLAALAVGVLFELPPVLHVILCFAAAMAAGALWGSIVALMKTRKGINEVLSYIMFNWIAFYLSNYVINLTVIHKVGGGEASRDINPSASIIFPEAVRDIFGGNKNANLGFFLAVLVAVIVWVIINKTTLGYKLRAVGFNNHAAQYGGINADRAVTTAMAISGALAGLGGAVQLMGMGNRISQFSAQEGFGFQGITVALIAGSSPIGCIFSGLFYGAMKYGGTKLSMVDAPQEVVDIIMGTIILFIAVSHVLRRVITAKVEKGGRKA